MKRKVWKKNGLVLWDRHGYARAVIAKESSDCYCLIGPFGMSTRAIPNERTFADLNFAKRIVEKELRDAGY